MVIKERMGAGTEILLKHGPLQVELLVVPFPPSLARDLHEFQEILSRVGLWTYESNKNDKIHGRENTIQTGISNFPQTNTSFHGFRLLDICTCVCTNHLLKMLI